MTICLVVDDSGVIRKLARNMLANMGVDAVEAENGAAAFERCTECVPDIVLLDWNMPIMDGMEFLKKLRGTNFPRQPKVLFCTSESDFSKIAEALAEGADEYIMKPFDEEILISKLRLVGAV